MSKNETKDNVLSEEQLFAWILMRTGINVPILVWGSIEDMTIGDLVAIRKACEELS